MTKYPSSLLIHARVICLNIKPCIPSELPIYLLHKAFMSHPSTRKPHWHRDHIALYQLVSLFSLYFSAFGKPLYCSNLKERTYFTLQDYVCLHECICLRKPEKGVRSPEHKIVGGCSFALKHWAIPHSATHCLFGMCIPCYPDFLLAAYNETASDPPSSSACVY